jgi:hypothetical protein
MGLRSEIRGVSHRGRHQKNSRARSTTTWFGKGGSDFADITDPQAIPVGKYRLYHAETPDNKTYWLYRLETQSGRTWFCSNNVWTEVTRAK